eukprot:424811-Alexandrium_andersonii.AAC.1
MTRGAGVPVPPWANAPASATPGISPTIPWDGAETAASSQVGEHSAEKHFSRERKKPKTGDIDGDVGMLEGGAGVSETHSPRSPRTPTRSERGRSPEPSSEEEVGTPEFRENLTRATALMQE